MGNTNTVRVATNLLVVVEGSTNFLRWVFEWVGEIEDCADEPIPAIRVGDARVLQFDEAYDAEEAGHDLKRWLEGIQVPEAFTFTDERTTEEN